LKDSWPAAIDRIDFAVELRGRSVISNPRRENSLDRKRPGIEMLRQRLALDHLHRDVGDGVRLADVVDRDDVGMVQTRRRSEPPSGSASIGRYQRTAPWAGP
jgi:hypothetical protein